MLAEVWPRWCCNRSDDPATFFSRNDGGRFIRGVLSHFGRDELIAGLERGMRLMTQCPLLEEGTEHSCPRVRHVLIPNIVTSRDDAYQRSSP